MNPSLANSLSEITDKLSSIFSSSSSYNLVLFVILNKTVINSFLLSPKN